jgi:hypothetical protein
MYLFARLLIVTSPVGWSPMSYSPIVTSKFDHGLLFSQNGGASTAESQCTHHKVGQFWWSKQMLCNLRVTQKIVGTSAKENSMALHNITKFLTIISRTLSTLICPLLSSWLNALIQYVANLKYFS